MLSLRFFSLLSFLALIFFSSFMSAHAADSASSATPSPQTNVDQIREKFLTVAQRPEYVQTDEEDIKSSFQNWMSVVLIEISTRWSHFKYAKEMQSLSYLLNSLFVLISFFALIMLFRRLIRRKPRAKRASKNPIAIESQPDRLASLLSELTQAELERNWSAAFSAAWRHLLIRLENQKILPADPSQTNTELVNYLSARGTPSSQKDIFQALVLDFDRTIYGHKNLRDEEWPVLKRKIQQVGQLFSLTQVAPSSGL